MTAPAVSGDADALYSAPDGIEIALVGDVDLTTASGLRGPCRTLVVVDGGDVTVTMASSPAPRLFTAVPAGAAFAIQATKITFAGTTARKFWAFW